MYCSNCGAQNPDDVSFCTKCGKSLKQNAAKTTASSGPVIAPSGVSSLKCPSCGAPIAPKFGEAVITCEYCGSGVTLGSQGWTNIQKQTVLTLKVATVDQAKAIIKPLMNNGILHRHRFEDAKEEELSLTYVPYWIVSVSARTSITVANQNAQLAQTAASAALLGVILGGIGGGFGGGGGGGRGGGRGGRRAFESQVILDNPFAGILGLRRIPIMAFGMGMGRGGGGNKKAEQMDENYYFPVIALKAYPDYQPQNYQFNLEGRELFDITKLPKSIKILNGDVNEDSAKSQAKTLVDQLQSQKAHAKYQAIQSIKTDCDVGDTELLHVPVWFAKYSHKKDKIVLVIDANSGKVINSQGL